MTLNRCKVASESAVPTGKVKIEVETKYDSKERIASATITLKVNGKQVPRGVSNGRFPIPIHKEQNGYALNSLLAPLLSAAGNLLFNGVSDIESIDKTWMISTGAKIGPFGIMDTIGMQTMYNIDMLWGEKLGDQSLLDRAALVKENHIDKGKMGVSTGEGFYKYPNPAYADPDFLK